MIIGDVTLNKLSILCTLTILFLVSSCQLGSTKKEADTINKYVIPAYIKAEGLSLKNPDSTLLLCDYLLRVTKDNKLADSIRLKVHILKNQTILNKGDNNKAIEMFKATMLEYEEKNDVASVALVRGYIAEMLNASGRWNESQYYIDKAINEYPRNKDPLIFGRFLNLKGLIATNLGRYKESELAFNEALTLFEKKNALGDCASALQNIGNLHFELKDSLLARDYYLRSLSIHQKIGSKKQLASIYNNIGLIYRYSNPDSALYYYNKIPPINGDNDNLQYYVIGLFNKANIYKDLSQYEKAREIFNEVNNICIENNILQGIPRVLYSFGEIECEVGNMKKGIAYIDDALRWCDSLDAVSLKQEILKGRIHYSTQIGNYKEAFLLQEQYNKVEDSLKNDETKASIEKIEKMNKEKLQLLDKMEKEKQMTSAKQKKNQQLLYITAALLLMFSIFVSYRYLLPRIKRASSNQ